MRKNLAGIPTNCCVRVVIFCAVAGCGILPALGMGPAAVPPGVNQDGTIDIPAFNMPFSSYASPEAKRALIEDQAINKILGGAEQRDAATFRKIYDDKLYLPLVAKQNARYSVIGHPQTIGGVYTEIFTPKSGESPENKNRVLINLHGGGFVIGARTVGRIESIPIAATARIKVISVDYRMAPEFKFPAASEDVTAVYRELLKQYAPQDIGIYGCSAGGLLTAQSLAWFQKEKLPMPGAVGIFCASTHGFMEGDSGQLAYRLGGADGAAPPRTAPKLAGPYFDGVSAADPLAAPSTSTALLSQFPPTLFVTGSRSFELSGACKSQVELTLAGVEARLSVWDGMTHAFFFDPDLPESREVYRVVAGFFQDHLGKKRS
jgi:monoterpene epsilon-lactone hydrolase